jgi:dTDP-4-dehydrorhamnose 3,5-epimerase
MVDPGRLRLFRETVKDAQTVTPDGESVQELIDGVAVRHATTHADERGDLCEIWDERWGFTPQTVPYVYFVELRPGSVRGWIVHLEQDDRLFIASGSIKVALYDAREDSVSVGLVNTFFFGTHDRALVRIPPGVFHAVKNVGHTDAVFVNLPSRPYLHEDPDKYRIPSDSEAVPYRL